MTKRLKQVPSQGPALCSPRVRPGHCIVPADRAASSILQHLDYITRYGRLLAELQDGTKIETRADLRTWHDDWLRAEHQLSSD